MRRTRQATQHAIPLANLILLENPNQVEAELCRRSLFYTLKTFWPTLDPATEPIWNWHIPYLAKELETVARRVGDMLPKENDLIINIPPGSTKSILVNVVFPVWCWLNWYWMRFISVSYSAPLSLELAEKSRDIIQSGKFKGLFPELELKRDKIAKGNFKIEKHFYNEKGEITQTLPGGNRLSTSVGGTVTGFHAHIRIWDDPLNPEQAQSVVELKTATNWLGSTFSSRSVDKKVTVEVGIMQRLHQKDPTGHELEKKRADLKHISLPGEIREYGDYLNPPELAVNYIDGLLDPIRMPWSVLKSMKAALGQYNYAGQVGQNPVPPGGGMFKVERFTMVTAVPNPLDIVGSIRYWDKAGTDDAGAFTVGCLMLRLRNGKFRVMDVKRFQKSSEIREQIMLDTAQGDGPEVRIYHEQEPGSGGKESAEATTRNLAGFSAYPDPPRGNKIFRADPWSVQVNEGNVELMVGEWNHEYIEEHRFCPFGSYMDQVDASSGAFSKLTKKQTAGSVLKRARG